MQVLRLNKRDFTESFADLENNQVTDKDWEFSEALQEILGVYHIPAMKLQKSHYPTISETIPIIFALLEKVESLKNTDALRGNPLIAFCLEKAKEMLLEYYPSSDDSIASNMMLYLAIVLDPRNNLAIYIDISA